MEDYLLLDVAIAYSLDLILGDPYWLPHPVRFIGWLVKRTESILRKAVNRKYAYRTPSDIENRAKGKGPEAVSERRAGAALMVIVVSVTVGLVFLILKLAAWINPLAFHIINVYFVYSALAGRCLGDEAQKVYRVLKTGDIPQARKSLAMLVGRETENLDGMEIARGVVETTAENTVDGVISPLFYAIAGSLLGLGAPIVYAFKAISTLDSMVGYMNEKYINFGRVSAKTDDVANYIPARLSGLLIPFGALFCGLDFKKSFLIMLRDRRNHKSPNCAYPEAAVAGALDIRIGGTNIYFGKAVEKPTIGDPARQIEPEDMLRTIRLMYASSTLTLILGLLAGKLILLAW